MITDKSDLQYTIKVPNCYKTMPHTLSVFILTQHHTLISG